MPVYDYECKMGHVTEREFGMEDARRKIKCPQCGRVARKIISCRGNFDDHPPWLDSSLANLISKRDPEYARLKENFSRQARADFMKKRGIVCYGDYY